jgi:hypothetical protein
MNISLMEVIQQGLVSYSKAVKEVKAILGEDFEFLIEQREVEYCGTFWYEPTRCLTSEQVEMIRQYK